MQELIGWDQVFLGRIAENWEQLGRNVSGGDTQQKSWVWTKQVIRVVWKYGLTLWQSRNSMVHGIDGSVSALDHTRTLELIKVMYRDVLPEVQFTRQEIFPLSESDMLEQTHQSQVAWLAKLRFLFPDKYRALELETVGKLQSDLELERQRMRCMGQTCWD